MRFRKAFLNYLKEKISGIRAGVNALNGQYTIDFPEATIQDDSNKTDCSVNIEDYKNERSSKGGYKNDFIIEIEHGTTKGKTKNREILDAYDYAEEMIFNTELCLLNNYQEMKDLFGIHFYEITEDEVEFSKEDKERATGTLRVVFTHNINPKYMLNKKTYGV